MKKPSLQSLKGKKIVNIDGGRTGLVLTLEGGETVEINSVYEGGIEIKMVREEDVTQRKTVTHRLD